MIHDLTRRGVMAGGLVIAPFLSQIGHAAMRSSTMSETDIATYDSNGIDLNALAAHWPDKHPQPRLIVQIAQAIAPWRWGLLSHFFISGARFNDHVVENGADLQGDFGIFIRISNGSDYALWYHDGCVPGAEPVVSIDDEGQHRVLAPTLSAFFTAWAEGKGVGMLEPFDYDATPELVAERRARGKDILALITASPQPDTPTPAPDFYAYMQDYGAAARATAAANPTLKAISKLLGAHIPRGKEDWEAEIFRLSADGDTISVETRGLEPDYTTHAPLPEREALIPLLAQARADRARGKTASLGPWKSAVMRLFPDGRVLISADWE